jgi:hypothetical protein
MVICLETGVEIKKVDAKTKFLDIKIFIYGITSYPKKWVN